MERAKFIRSFRPMILLGIIIFILTIFIPISSTKCEVDKKIINVYSKYPDGPVIVPEMEFGEPGSSPHLRGILIPDSDSGDSSKNEMYLTPKAVTKTWDFMFFLQYMLNQISNSN